ERRVDLQVADPVPARDDIECRLQVLVTRTGSVIGAYRLDGPLCDSSAKRVLVLLVAERRRAGIEPGIGLEKTLLGQMKIHGTRLDIDRQAASLAFFGDAKRPFRRQMNDVDGRSGRFSDGDRPLDR